MWTVGWGRRKAEARAVAPRANGEWSPGLQRGGKQGRRLMAALTKLGWGRRRGAEMPRPQPMLSAEKWKLILEMWL